MHRHRLNGLLLRPSLLSATVCLLSTVGILISANWPVALDSMPFYDYFFGPAGLVTIIQNADGGGSAIGQALTSSSVSHNAKILGGAVMAGLVLYCVLRLVMLLFNSISFTLKEMQAVDTPAKHIVEHELEKRVGIRVLVAFVWAAYTFISIKIVLPFCILASELSLNQQSNVSEGVGYLLFAVVLLVVTLHVHVIIARLFLLKPRVFGSTDVILGK